VFKPIITGHEQADSIAADYGQQIFEEAWSIKRIAEHFGCSNYCARRVRVAVGLSTSDPLQNQQTHRRRARATKDTSAPYEMDTLSGEYVFTFAQSRHTAPLRISRETIGQMVLDYSNSGGALTQAQLANRYGLSRWMVRDVLTSLGVVKAGVPFTEEDVQLAVEENALHLLDQRWLAAAKLQVESRVDRQRERTLAKDALKWREAELYTLEWAKEASASVAAAVASWESQTLAGPPKPGEPCTVVLGVTDLHYGAYAWHSAAGGHWNREVCRKRLVSSIGSVIDRLPQGMTVDRFVLPIGSDLAHCDTATGTTTKGTRQDLDGTPEQMVHELWHLIHALILALAEVAEVDLWLMEANHDGILGHALFASLSVAFGDSERVHIKRDRSSPHGPYQLGVYGKTLLGFAHGDGRHSPADLSAVMSQQGREHWSSTEHRIWVTGHRHAHSVREDHGVEVHVMPSLSGADRYHAKNWPIKQQPRMKALVLHPEDGLVCSIFGKPSLD